MSVNNDKDEIVKTITSTTTTISDPQVIPVPPPYDDYVHQLKFKEYVKIHWPEWHYIHGLKDPTPALSSYEQSEKTITIPATSPKKPTPVQEMIQVMRRQFDQIIAKYNYTEDDLVREKKINKKEINNNNI